jgi:hypothetical protein
VRKSPIYEADVDLVPGDVQVEVVSADPPNPDPTAVARAKDAIRRGAEQVLQPRGLGAIIHVRRIVIHPVDFKPRRFELHTAEELCRLLAAGV